MALIRVARPWRPGDAILVDERHIRAVDLIDYERLPVSLVSHPPSAPIPESTSSFREILEGRAAGISTHAVADHVGRRVPSSADFDANAVTPSRPEDWTAVYIIGNKNSGKWTFVSDLLQLRDSYGTRPPPTASGYESPDEKDADGAFPRPTVDYTDCQYTTDSNSSELGVGDSIFDMLEYIRKQRYARFEKWRKSKTINAHSRQPIRRVFFGPTDGRVFTLLPSHQLSTMPYKDSVIILLVDARTPSQSNTTAPSAADPCILSDDTRFRLRHLLKIPSVSCIIIALNKLYDDNKASERKYWFEAVVRYLDEHVISTAIKESGRFVKDLSVSYIPVSSLKGRYTTHGVHESTGGWYRGPSVVERLFSHAS
ncbi:uncharacterized protein V2V93DRAFT_364301 [Kockiozyma suomiensis]|uniref:uncharacterized protein n=1 Tax=Kockiozyma suomiensis TaxID=1337062 RepID=UPI00334394F6